MLKKYTFSGDGTIEFEDSKSVSELIRFAFDEFGYYEPAGMELVSLFQVSYPGERCGWFTTDTKKSCFEEIKNPDDLCFAYYLPGVFYFAEGGWGHHMIELGNHPVIPEPVSIKIRFEDFENTVVINGNYCFGDIIRFLTTYQYITDCNEIKVRPIGISNAPYALPFSDSIMNLKLPDFIKRIKELNEEHYPNHSRINHVVYEIC